MLADIPQARGAEQGIGDGVQHDIRIAVPGQPAIVRNLDPAQHDRPFAGEGMNVETHSSSADQTRSLELLGALPVGGARELVEHRIPFDGNDLEPRSDQERRFVRGLPQAAFG